MNARVGWALAALAIGVGFAAWGWRGALLGISVTVFWLLLQFSRALGAMRRAAQAPVGHVDSAVMLQARLQPGMLMMQVLPLTRSLGEKVTDEPETWLWRDAGGDAVRVEMRAGRVSAVQLLRAAAGDEAQRGQAGQ